MAAPVKLHPKIRERKAARVSASALAEFIITTPDRQDEVLHDARYMRGPPASAYSDALRAITAYCSDLHRDSAKLQGAHSALVTKSLSSVFKPSQREEAVRCAEVIDLFRDSINAYGANSSPFLEWPRSDPLIVGKTIVSIQPDLIAAKSYPPQKERIGLVFFRPQKRPDPNDCKTPKTRDERIEYRREMARYMLVMGWMLLVDQGIPETAIDPKKMTVWDFRMKEMVGFPTDRISRIKRVKAACGQIYRLWATIQPKPGDLVA